MRQERVSAHTEETSGQIRLNVMITCSILVLLLSPMDFILRPFQSVQFLLIRTLTAAVLFSLYFVASRSFARFLNSSSMITALVTMSAMSFILYETKGESIPYYLQLIILSLVIAGYETFSSPLRARSSESREEWSLALDRNWIIQRVSDTFLRLSGYESSAILNRPYSSIDTKKAADELKEIALRLENQGRVDYETQIIKENKDIADLEVSACSMNIDGTNHICLSVKEVTEKKRLFKQLLHAQKMESVGFLAGGIAHDFNNILTSVLGYAELIRMEDNNLSEMVRERLTVVENAARKGTQLVRQLLGFTRKNKVEIKPLSINDCIKDSLKLLSRLVDRAIHMVLELSPDITMIMADVNQIEQVIMNLVINARDAMPQGGTLTIATRRVSLDAQSINVSPATVQPGEYLHLAISDTGTGIKKEHLDKIFEPFFTTKEIGKGTGLGLAMVYSIVKDHHGYITVESTFGAGTRFDLYFPASKQVIEEAKEENIQSNNLGTEKILLIEDELPILEYAEAVLTRFGYTVIATTNPHHAVQLYQDSPDKYDLIITDIIMPGLSGKQVIEHVRTKNPKVRILVMSGYTESMDSGMRSSIKGFIKKPFEHTTFLSAVRSVLDGKMMNAADN